MQLSDYEKEQLNEFGKSIQSGRWSNEGLVQLIELSSGFLNLKTIPNYAKSEGISYNGAKKFRCIREIAGVKFVIDNK